MQKVLSRFRIQNSFFLFSVVVISQSWIKDQVLDLSCMTKGIQQINSAEARKNVHDLIIQRQTT